MHAGSRGLAGDEDACVLIDADDWTRAQRQVLGADRAGTNFRREQA